LFCAHDLFPFRRGTLRGRALARRDLAGQSRLVMRLGLRTLFGRLDLAPQQRVLRAKLFDIRIRRRRNGLG
jgi:hypothetical protein